MNSGVDNNMLLVDNNVKDLLKNYKKEDIVFYEKLVKEKDEYDLATKIDCNYMIRKES